jgi:sec-independent protein translocase protein TatA
MELIIVLGIVVVIFGAGKLADLGGALGKGIRQFREETTVEGDKEKEKEAKASAATTASAAPVAAPAAPVASTASDACPSCGRTNPAGQPFCGGCGASLKTPAATTT